MNWREDIFDNFVRFKRGFDLPEASLELGPYPVIASTSIMAHHKDYRVKGPGVVTGRSGSLGSVQYVQGNYWPHNTSLYVKDFKGNNPRYAFYILQKMHLENFNSGAGVPTLNQNHLHRLKIRIPPLQTQRKIAAILWAYDELIENNKRRIELLETIAEEIYREWFVRLRFPGHQDRKSIKGVPTGWEVRRLESIGTEIRQSVKKKDLSNEENYLGLEHIPRRSISIKERTTAETVISDKLRFQERDILFGKIRPYLHKVALAHFSGVCSSDTIVIRPRNTTYEGYLLFTVFSDTFVDLATVASKGTKMPRADWGFLKKLELAVPSKEVVEAYQQRFDVMFSEIVNLLRANEMLITSRDALLLRLISGKLSVENLVVQFPPSMVEELNGERGQAKNA